MELYCSPTLLSFRGLFFRGPSWKIPISDQLKWLNVIAPKKDGAILGLLVFNLWAPHVWLFNQHKLLFLLTNNQWWDTVVAQKHVSNTCATIVFDRQKTCSNAYMGLSKTWVPVNPFQITMLDVSWTIFRAIPAMLRTQGRPRVVVGSAMLGSVFLVSGS